MKVYAKPVNVLAVFSVGENPRPYKIKFENDRGEIIKINIDAVLYIEERRKNGVSVLEYTCQSNIDNRMQLYNLRYVFNEMKWELYKKAS